MAETLQQEDFRRRRPEVCLESRGTKVILTT